MGGKEAVSRAYVLDGLRSIIGLDRGVVGDRIVIADSDS